MVSFINQDTNNNSSMKLKNGVLVVSFASSLAGDLSCDFLCSRSPVWIEVVVEGMCLELADLKAQLLCYCPQFSRCPRCCLDVDHSSCGESVSSAGLLLSQGCSAEVGSGEFRGSGGPGVKWRHVGTWSLLTCF